MPRRSLSTLAGQTPARTPHQNIHSTRKQSRARGSPNLSSPDPLAPSPEIGRKGRGRRVTIAIGEEEEPGSHVEVPNGGAQGAQGGGEGDEASDEAKHDAWLEFASEHYEMVEQLPLELHRNFRLLRELDDGCVGES